MVLLIAQCPYTCFNTTKVRLKLSFCKNAPGVRVFQYHKGAIKTRLYRFVRFRRISFNTTKVRLKPARRAEQNPGFAGFNTTKVRLKQPLSGWPFQVMPGFNTTKVRLKLLHKESRRHLAFQYHKGAIKTNFIKILLNIDIESFNTTKVRLKRRLNRFRSDDAMFQYHKGAIKTSC